MYENTKEKTEDIQKLSGCSKQLGVQVCFSEKCTDHSWANTFHDLGVHSFTRKFFLKISGFHVCTIILEMEKVVWKISEQTRPEKHFK